MDQKVVGAFIASLRRELGLTQAELGGRLGVTNKTVSRWENGNYMPDLSLLQELCRELGISVNELLSGQRLDEAQFRRRADSNLVSALSNRRTVLREKRLSSFFQGAGTGMLCSAVWAPESFRRTVIAVLSIAMIAAGWYWKSRLEARAMQNSGPPEAE